MTAPTRKWRNWQTRRIQDATTCPTVAATPASSFDLRSAVTGPGRSRGYVQGTTGHDAESDERDSSLGVGVGLVLVAYGSPEPEQPESSAARRDEPATARNVSRGGESMLRPPIRNRGDPPESGWTMRARIC